MTAICLVLVLLLGAALAARYGSDSRAGGDPSGRDPAWPQAPVRTHTVTGDARWIAACARRIAARRRAWAAFDHARRVWEGT